MFNNVELFSLVFFFSARVFWCFAENDLEILTRTQALLKTDFRNYFIC